MDRRKKTVPNAFIRLNMRYGGILTCRTLQSDFSQGVDLTSRHSTKGLFRVEVHQASASSYHTNPKFLVFMAMINFDLRICLLKIRKN